MVEQGDQLYIGRYLVTGADAASLYLEVQSKTASEIKCVALNDANLDGLLTVFHMERSTKGISNKSNQQPLFSQLDTDSLRALAAEFDFDFLSLSYTRSAEDVVEARKFLNSIGLDACRIIAKLDAKQSLANFRGILNSADGIMLSRGNLGLDCLPEKVTVIQKNVTTSCNLVGKPCIVTRILDTMVSAPRPTRAEATDVANAVLDGADCLMLGAETLRGHDPANAVKTVVSCCQAAEAEFDHASHFEYLMSEAVKAEEGGIAVPGGTDSDFADTLDGSGHGNTHFGGQPGPAGARLSNNLAASASHANLTTSIQAMTRTAPSSVNLAASQSSVLRLIEHSFLFERLCGVVVLHWLTNFSPGHAVLFSSSTPTGEERCVTVHSCANTSCARVIPTQSVQMAVCGGDLGRCMLCKQCHDIVHLCCMPGRGECARLPTRESVMQLQGHVHDPMSSWNTCDSFAAARR